MNEFQNLTTVILRVIAVLIDFIVLNIMALGIFLQFFNEEKSLGNLLYLLNSYLITIICLFFINGYLYNKLGGSLGKIACFLKVKKEEGEFLTFEEYFYREFIYKSLSKIIFGLGYLYPFFNQDRKAFHDYAAKTSVSGKVNLIGVLAMFLIISSIFVVAFQFNNQVLISDFQSKNSQHLQKIIEDLSYHLNN